MHGKTWPQSPSHMGEHGAFLIATLPFGLPVSYAYPVIFLDDYSVLIRTVDHWRVFGLCENGTMPRGWRLGRCLAYLCCA